MAKFQIEVGGTTYDMEFTRDSAVEFESAGGTLENMRSQIYLTATRLFVIGLMTPKDNLMNKNLAAKVLEKALDEYGVAEVYATVADPFLEVFMQAGTSTGKKSMRVKSSLETAE